MVTLEKVERVKLVLHGEDVTHRVYMNVLGIDMDIPDGETEMTIGVE